MGLFLDDAVVAGQVKPLAVVGLEVRVGRLFAKPAERLGEMPVEDDEGIARVGMRIEALGQEHVGPQVHGPAPELGQPLALDSLVLDVLGGRRFGDRRDDLVEADADRRVVDSGRPRS